MALPIPLPDTLGATDTMERCEDYVFAHQSDAEFARFIHRSHADELLCCEVPTSYTSLCIGSEGSGLSLASGFAE